MGVMTRPVLAGILLSNTDCGMRCARQSFAPSSISFCSSNNASIPHEVLVRCACWQLVRPSEASSKQICRDSHDCNRACHMLHRALRGASLTAYRYFNLKEGKAILYGPGSIHHAHSRSEMIGVAELKHAVEAYRRIAKYCLSQK